MEYKFKEEYDNILHQEEEVIREFLLAQASIMEGVHIYTWYFKNNLHMMNTSGTQITVPSMKIVNNKDVLFKSNVDGRDYGWWRANSFAYGELSKVINTIPTIEQIQHQIEVKKLYGICLAKNVNYFLAKAPFKYVCGDLRLSIDKLDGDCLAQQIESLVSNYGMVTTTEFCRHIHQVYLHESEEYKTLIKLLDKLPQKAFNFAEHEDCHSAFINIKVDNQVFDVFDVSLDDDGKLVIITAPDNEGVYGENFTFYEKDLYPKFLTDIIKRIKLHVLDDIMDTANGHNPKFVELINESWKDKKHHKNFEAILHILLEREYDKYCKKFEVPEVTTSDYAMEHAHDILQGICDDVDLECILLFVGNMR